MGVGKGECNPPADLKEDRVATGLKKTNKELHLSDGQVSLGFRELKSSKTGNLNYRFVGLSWA